MVSVAGAGKGATMNSMTHTITGFAEAEALLKRLAPAQLPRRAYTLEYMQHFMEYIGNPQNKLRVVHVAGTSGKTSTCYYIASLLQATGKKVGLSVSPFIDHMNERVQINLVPLPERQFCEELALFLSLVNKSNIQLTRFELLSAFAYWEFARQQVDYVVMEVGMGGTYDATNVITNQDKVCVITDIGLDHQKQLGDTLGEITAHKAGIIGLGNTVFCYKQHTEVMDAIFERARQCQADVHILHPMDLSKEYSFLPVFQQRNFGLSKAVEISILKRDALKPLTGYQMLEAAKVHIPGRMEVVKIQGKTVILDGAHNAQKLHALRTSLVERYPGKTVAVLAAFKAKHSGRIEQASAELAALADHIIITSYGAPGSSEPYGEDPDIIAALCKVHGFWAVECVEDPARAWRRLLARPEDILLVTGSFYLFNDIRPLLK